MVDLLPCPFCAGQAKRVDIEAQDGIENSGCSFINCTKCDASTALHFDRKENLVSSWNDRAGHPACEDLEGACDWREEHDLVKAQLTISRERGDEWQKKAQRQAVAIEKLRGDLRAWEITSRMIEEGEREACVEAVNGVDPDQLAARSEGSVSTYCKSRVDAVKAIRARAATTDAFPTAEAVLDKAKNEGRDTYRLGLARTLNPYMSTQIRDAWFAGYDDGAAS